MIKHCENCGCRIYKHGCVNCYEVLYIADQYEELDIPMSEKFAREVEAKRQERPTPQE